MTDARERRLWPWLASGLGVVVLAAGTAWLMRPAPACEGPGQVAGDPSRLGGPFTLVDETGATVTDADVITGPTLMYFGYTFCPDICPYDNARNADAAYLLAERGYQMRPVFVSVDTARDTPALLAEFTDIMHPEMLGLTGTPEQVAAAARAYRAFYHVNDPEDEWTLIDHSTYAYLTFPGSQVVTVFDRSATAQDIATAAACQIDRMTRN